MNFKNLMNKNAWKGAVSAVGMKLVAVKPEILLIVGSISVLAGTIYACRKTKESEKVFEEAKIASEGVNLTLKEAKETVTDAEELKKIKIETGKQYVRIYGKLAYDFVKVYGVPALLWFGGMGMIFGAHGELRKINSHLVADSIAVQNLLKEYRERVSKAVGEEVEQKIFMGAQEGTVQVLEKDEKTGEEKLVKKKADIFYAQPGSIFARNFTEETSDAFDIRSFAEHYLDSRIDSVNKNLELGVSRAYTGLDILRMLGFNENALGEDENIDALIRNGISGNARKVQDPEMRKLKVTRLRGYQKKWDAERNVEVFVPCLRLDFNFYPLEGKI